MADCPKRCGCEEMTRCDCGQCILVTYGCAVLDTRSKINRSVSQELAEGLLQQSQNIVRSVIQDNCFNQLCDHLKENNGCAEENCWIDLLDRVKPVIYAWSEYYYIITTGKLNIFNTSAGDSNILPIDKLEFFTKTYRSIAEASLSRLRNYMEDDTSCYQCCYTKKTSNNCGEGIVLPRIDENDFDFLL